MDDDDSLAIEDGGGLAPDTGRLAKLWRADGFALRIE